MLNKQEVEEIMKGRGFYKQAEYRQDNQTRSITFNTTRLDGTDMACIVNLVNESFKFIWCVPNSINRLVTPDCGSLFDDEHFHKLYRNMFKQVRILYCELQK